MKFSAVLLSSLLYLYTSLLQAETKVYYWVDDSGKMHFSDTAAPGTEEITTTSQNLLSSDRVASKTTDSNSDAVNTESQEMAVIDYKADIISPKNDMPIRSNNGTLEIHVKISPEKENTQKLQLYLDGTALGSPQISSTIRALNIDRGTHQVQVYLLDEKGKTLTKTQIITVHLLRASLK